jgi:hypothetical protein
MPLPPIQKIRPSAHLFLFSFLKHAVGPYLSLLSRKKKATNNHNEVSMKTKPVHCWFDFLIIYRSTRSLFLSTHSKSSSKDEDAEFEFSRLSYSKKPEPGSFDWIRRWWYWKTHQPPLWCFRPVKRDTDPCHPWQSFSHSNQKLVWLAFYQQKEAQLVDPRILQGKQLVRVMVQEELAFVIDPDWPQPLLYDVALLPVISSWSWRWK